MLLRMLTLLPEALIIVAAAVDSATRAMRRLRLWVSGDHEPFPLCRRAVPSKSGSRRAIRRDEIAPPPGETER